MTLSESGGDFYARRRGACDTANRRHLLVQARALHARKRAGQCERAGASGERNRTLFPGSIVICRRESYHASYLYVRIVPAATSAQLVVVPR